MGRIAGTVVAAVLAMPVLPLLAQKPPPTPAERAEAVQPVRVVCIADKPESFLRDEAFRSRVLGRLVQGLPEAAAQPGALVQPLGVRYGVALGAGFVVDPERRHVVTSWQVATACRARDASRQLAVVEPGGAQGSAQLAERLPDRPVKLVQALCRDRLARCDADLPQPSGAPPLAEAERARQLDNLLTYAPDLAVLRLASPLRTLPLALALNQQLDDQMRLVVRGPAAPAADAAPASLPALYTGPQQFSALPPGGQAEDEIHARFHRLAMRVQPGLGGSPVLRGEGVVGVLSVMLDAPAVAGDAAGLGKSHAVPVTVLAGFLDLLKVPYLTSALELPARSSEAALPSAPAGPRGAEAPVATTAPGSSWADSRRWMLIGAAALALVAAASFLLLMRRRRDELPAAVAAPPAMPLPVNTQRTVTRVDPTLLHAVAMPTSAIEPPPSAEAPAASPAAPPVEAEPVVEARLHVKSGPLAGAIFSLPMPNGGCTLQVGRDPRSCQVVMPPSMDQVSGVHACFVWSPETRTMTLRDLSSSGTWRNGQRIEKGATITLARGDRVDLGAPELNRIAIDVPFESETRQPRE